MEENIYEGKRNMCLSSNFCNLEHMVEEILLRLSLKPLHKCMSLSKDTRSLISSNGFHQKYRKSRARNDSKILIGFFYQPVNLEFYGFLRKGFVPTSNQGRRLIERGFDVSLSFLEPSSSPSDEIDATRFSLVGSSNGFLLCKKEWFLSDRNLSNCEYYVRNPLTGQRTTLPNPPTIKLRVAFETFDCRGYPCLDWVTYKVVRGSSICHGNLQVEIFSSKTGDWIALQLSIRLSCTLMLCEYTRPVMSESEMVCLMALSCEFGDDEVYYLMFNAEQKTDELQIVKSPKPTEFFQALLGQSQGFIYIMTNNKCSDETEFWELNEDKGIWVLKYSIKRSDILSGDFGYTMPFFLGLDPSNSTLALVGVDNKISLVDIKKKSYVFTSAYPDDLDYYIQNYLWLPYQWPTGAIGTQ